MKKILLTSSFILLFLFSWSQRYKNKYKNCLESGSTLIYYGYNYTTEKTKEGNYILKVYYPENKMVTKHITYSSLQTNEKMDFI